MEIVAMRDDAERGDDVFTDGILTQRPPLCEAAGQARGEQTRFREVSDLVLAIQQREVAPRQSVSLSVTTQVLDHPGDLGLLVSERAHHDVEWGIAIDVELLSAE